MNAHVGTYPMPSTPTPNPACLPQCVVVNKISRISGSLVLVEEIYDHALGKTEKNGIFLFLAVSSML